VKRLEGKTAKVSAEEGMSEKSRLVKSFVRPFISLSTEPLSLTSSIIDRPDAACVSPVMYLSFSKPKFYSAGTKWFLIVVDDQEFAKTIGFRARRFKDYSSMARLFEGNPAFGFFMHYCHIDEDAFRRAMDNYGVRFSYAFDYALYEKDCGGPTSYTTQEIIDSCLNSDALKKEELRLRRHVIRDFPLEIRRRARGGDDL